MKGKCEWCNHWQKTEYSFGTCSKIQEKIEITLLAGSEGAVVEFIETEAGFGCKLWEELNA